MIEKSLKLRSQLAVSGHWAKTVNQFLVVYTIASVGPLGEDSKTNYDGVYTIASVGPLGEDDEIIFTGIYSRLAFEGWLGFHVLRR